MRNFYLAITLIFLLQNVYAQTNSLTVKTWVGEEVTDQFNPSGRIFLFVSSARYGEPRLNIWPNKETTIFALNIEKWNSEEIFTFDATSELNKTSDITLSQIPAGKYTVQVLWDQDLTEPGIENAGNLYSSSAWIDFKNDTILKLPLKHTVEPQKLHDHSLLKEVNIKSNLISSWWNRDVYLKSAVLLPSGFHQNPDKKYPVRYNIGGYGGRYTRANRYVTWDKSFLNWWLSDEAPQIINVFLDGTGPYGDCYQFDSENNGPYGTALIEELIPYIEKTFRGIAKPEFRFLDGCSTGGWVSLALQLFYPDFFGGCFSYSPDPVDFENFQLINIYDDDNAFINKHGYLRPITRELSGQPVISQKDFVQFENVLGRNNTYTTSGGQIGAFTALFSPKGDDGLPRPLFHPQTGKIDREVAEHWRKYDLKQYVESNWDKIGEKLKGKIYIWMGDMDEFYLNTALRSLDKTFREMENPKSDALIEYFPMTGHCSGYNDRNVLEQISEKINSLTP